MKLADNGLYLEMRTVGSLELTGTEKKHQVCCVRAKLGVWTDNVVAMQACKKLYEIYKSTVTY